MILQRINGFALCHLLPPLVWQAVFFVGPLLFLLVLTFWSVQSYRLDPDSGSELCAVNAATNSLMRLFHVNWTVGIIVFYYHDEAQFLGLLNL